MSDNPPHTAKAILFSCIDDRLAQPDEAFMESLPGGAFHASLAGGGAALIATEDQATALKQITAAFRINHTTDVYLESHFDCGAYRLAGITFENAKIELERLTADLQQAASNVEAALGKAGAKQDEVTIHLRIVDTSGQLVWGA